MLQSKQLARSVAVGVVNRDGTTVIQEGRSMSSLSTLDTTEDRSTVSHLQDEETLLAVRQKVRNQLFRKKKFVTDDSEIRDAKGKVAMYVARIMDVSAEEMSYCWNRGWKVVTLRTLNDSRNNTVQLVKKKYAGM